MSLPGPHGGALVRLLAPPERRALLREECVRLPSWDLTPRQVCDLELLLNGGFSPLSGFLSRTDYESVCERSRLSSGIAWPMPVMLDVTEAFAATIGPGARVALRHPEGMVLAVLTVEETWKPDFRAEARAVLGTDDPLHPHAFALLNRTNPVYAGGRLEGVEMPPSHAFKEHRHDPAELRALFAKRGWRRVAAFHARDPMHRADVELARHAALGADANLLIHPVIGTAMPGDVDQYSRVRCYLAALPHLAHDTTMLSLLPLATRVAGPREALWHAIVRQNYGCSHVIVERDHAGAGNDAAGKPFHEARAAQELVASHAAELEIEPIPAEEMVRVQDGGEYLPVSEVPRGARVLGMSGAELRRRLQDGLEIPAWFTYPEVAAELRRSSPARSQQGFTVFFTGFSGSGKSTIANVLVARLMETGGRPVTLLDGDVVRKHLSSELGFSREHRDLNIRRIGFVASEITKNRGVAICAPIAPYAAARREVRQMISPLGGFIEVHVATPLQECEARDRKGLYAKARAGLVKGFTGIDDPYEAPEKAELVIDTTHRSADECAQDIILCLERQGFLGRPDGAG